MVKGKEDAVDDDVVLGVEHVDELEEGAGVENDGR